MKLLKKLFIVFVLLVCCSTAYGGYNSIDKNNIRAYNTFYSKVNKLSKSIDIQISVLEKLNNEIDTILNQASSLTIQQQKVFSDYKKLNNEKIFNIKFNNLNNKNKKAFTNQTVESFYQRFSYNEDRLFLENGVWYFYDFTHYSSFENQQFVNEVNLKFNKLWDKNVLVYISDGVYYFVSDYKKVKIISNDIIYGFPNKLELLQVLKKNKSLGLTGDDDKVLLEIEKKALEITKGLSKPEDKIEAVYAYVLDNIEYAMESIHNNDTPQHHSGIESYRSGKGVCEGYVELFLLMLGFNNISSELIIGDVFDVVDFPKISHVWVKIGDYYYDPTYDDPIGADRTLTKTEYSFFKIPKDLFYINRYDYGTTPEYLKTRTLEFRQSLALQNLIKVYPKYKNSDYKTIKPIKFKDLNGLPLDSKLNIENISKIVPNYELKSNKLYNSSSTRYISSIEYFEINDNLMTRFLDENDYNIKDYYLIKWYKDDNSIQYIFAQESKIIFVNN